MTTAIAIFVKTPALSPLKTRLAAGIGKEKAIEFYLLSLKAVERNTKSTSATGYYVVGEEEGVSDPLWSGLESFHTGEGDLGERQYQVYEKLLSQHDNVLLIGSDSPQMSPEIINQAITNLENNDFTIGPARDGGYYLFGGRVSLPKEAWTTVPWSTSTTRERLEDNLPSKPVHLSILSDVDEQEDLAEIAKEMPDQQSLEQKQLVEWINSL